MSRPMTPGRLAKTGGVLIAVAFLFVLGASVLGSILDEELVEDSYSFARIIPVLGGLVLLGAGIAKVVETGVRSAGDDRGGSS
jgi:hypothetical protein